MDGSIRLLVEDVATEFGVPAKDILGPWQQRRVSRIRHLCFALCIDVLRANGAEVGAVFGRSANTVLEGAMRYRMLLKNDESARLVFEKVAAIHGERFRLSLLGELDFMNRMVTRYRRRAHVIAGLLGIEGAERQEAEAAE
jgi:hypothetical protein